jgi:uncharacterized membrane protein YphA (DoxX/SURF4 family)
MAAIIDWKRDLIQRYRLPVMFELQSAAEPTSQWLKAFKAVLAALPRIGVGALFVFIGYTKFDSDPRGPWFQIFEQIGLGQWFRYLTGVMQVAGGVLLMFRRTLTVGAVMLGCTMAGAAFVDRSWSASRYSSSRFCSSLPSRQYG